MRVLGIVALLRVAMASLSCPAEPAKEVGVVGPTFNSTMTSFLEPTEVAVGTPFRVSVGKDDHVYLKFNRSKLGGKLTIDYNWDTTCAAQGRAAFPRRGDLRSANVARPRTGQTSSSWAGILSRISPEAPVRGPKPHQPLPHAGRPRACGYGPAPNDSAPRRDGRVLPTGSRRMERGDRVG